MVKKLSIVALMALMASCTYQNNNKIVQDDVREGDDRVYGVHPDSTARQLKVQYTSKPELGAKAVEIKEKWYK